MSTYKDRCAERKQNKANREALEAAHLATLERIQEVVTHIEAAFKPEADRLHLRVCTSWMKAREFAVSVNGDAREGAKKFGVPEYPVAPIGYHYRQKHLFPEYEKLKEEHDEWSRNWTSSKAFTLIIRKLWAVDFIFTNHMMKNADDILAQEKYKLLHSVTKYLAGFKELTVTHNRVVRNVEGFEGRFLLMTEKGRVVFNCRAIYAGGEHMLKRLHTRFISRIKLLD